MSTFEKAPYHHGDLRRALVESARLRLREGGVEAVSLREVARGAGVSHNAPYRHFPSREALLAAVAEAGFTDLRERLEAAGAELPALGRAYLDFAVSEREHFLLMFGSTLPKAAFPDLATAARAALAVLDRAMTGETRVAGPVCDETLRAWALVHGLAHLVADGQLAPEAAAAALASPCAPG